MQIPLVTQEPEEKKKREIQSCHGTLRADALGLPVVAIVGSPNVGKSVLFNTLTGAYITVSNYPGTTVEIARGKGRLGEREVGVVDTPGMYGLLPITEEERVAREILLREHPQVIVHVTDAKNLERMLPMTIQLIETGLNVILNINMIDEAERLGIRIDTTALEKVLGVPVVGTSLALGRGVRQLKETIAGRLDDHSTMSPIATPQARIPLHPAIEGAIANIEERLEGTYPLAKRTIALLLLQGDPELTSLVRGREDGHTHEISHIVKTVKAEFSQPISYIVMHREWEGVRKLLQPVLRLSEEGVSGFAEKLSRAMIYPPTGIPLLLVSLFMFYEFVGVLGAQTLVNFLENGVFGAYINPGVDQMLSVIFPWAAVRELFGGQYGVITLGVRYAVAIILPIVGTFFIAFSILEDSGYLPRLALLIDRVFKKIGLNGRGVIPMVLGFGCDTMATVVTRTLETKRERILSTFLLALAVPCSAQLGVMLGLLGGRPRLLLLWMSIVSGVFLLIGYLAARVMPGERPTFYMELPPLRLPTLGNVMVKTYTRMEWYLREVFPLFIMASVIIWLGQLTGLFDLVLRAIVPLVRWIGLPDQTAVAFLFGFFRRDFGAAGLFDLREAMNGVQLLVATTTITLFVPCIAQFTVTLKERGWKTALAINAFIFPFAFLVGGLLDRLLIAWGGKL